jgi:hypothetical protein
MTANEILAITDFLSDEMTDAQAERLMDECRPLSIADRERLLATVEGGPLYGRLAEHDREISGLSRY